MKDIDKLSHVESVEFALFCAKKCARRISIDTNESECIRSIENWLKDPSEKNSKACEEIAMKTFREAYSAVTYAIVHAANSVHYAWSTHAYNSAYWASSALNVDEDDIYHEWMSERLWKLMEKDI